MDLLDDGLDEMDEVGDVDDMVCWFFSHLGSRPGGEEGGRRKQLWIRTLQSSSPPPTPTIKKVISERKQNVLEFYKKIG